MRLHMTDSAAYRNAGMISHRRLPKIGLHHCFPSTSGPGRYVEALLAGIDPEEFEVVAFGIEGNAYSQRALEKMIYLNSVNPLRSSDSVITASGQPSAWARATKRCRGYGSVAYRTVVPFSGKFAAGCGRDALRKARSIRPHGIDLFHAQHAGVIEEASLAARLAGVSHVLATVHMEPSVDVDQTRSHGLFRLLQFAGLRSVHRAIAVSESTNRAWRRRIHLPSQRITTIHNGIDPEYFRRTRSREDARRLLGLPADERILIGAAGRLHPQKGFEYLVEAIALLANAFPNLTLVLAGDGECGDKLRDQAASLGILDRVVFLGYCADVRIVYDAIDIFALSSLCEALPYALLEAMSHELPVAATDVGGIPEVVAPGTTGYVAPVRDAAGLAVCLRSLLESADLRRKLGAAGRRRVIDRFHERDCVRKTINIYRELLACGKAGHGIRLPAAGRADRETAVLCDGAGYDAR